MLIWHGLGYRFRTRLARRALRQLKLIRFVVQRWKFHVYYHRRLRSSLVIIRALRYYCIRSAYLLIRQSIQNARLIQTFYRHYKFRLHARLVIQVMKTSRKQIHHCLYFGIRRAVVKINQFMRLTVFEQRAGNLLLRAWKKHFRKSRLEL